jgi:hypothetical protein
MRPRRSVLALIRTSRELFDESRIDALIDCTCRSGRSRAARRRESSQACPPGRRCAHETCRVDTPTTQLGFTQILGALAGLADAQPQHVLGGREIDSDQHVNRPSWPPHHRRLDIKGIPGV